ncbi:PREDICTED: uncharacterized protein LOC108769405 [Trachymyrmex cornetzi]|uniref:uncharacterized protein LOC108769405 n=1 Tax=Trachymyrmex cornetzi TaxID=471704 RepID=UPI00084F431B|nr:PREDICTED: uncharacterized protein LOC108769405 [Trachymyrmex cornetzi]XP_018375873.1 PREDICTED: uncharacterized protein LOC108769405 [Trachymyrmex cornetzi]XP_018375874.1 PREDICTED: uncharacterized protein LOC108769405 [Trachymyrmex cornetzi]
MSICAVKDCTNSFRKTKMKGLTIKYFTFPKNAEFIEAWRRVCRDGINVKYARICSKHFESWCYEKSAQQIALNYSPLRGRKLRADAIPTLYLFSEPHMAAEPTQSVDCKPKEILEAMQENIQLISSQIVLDGAEVASPKALNVKVENTDYAQQLKRTPVFNSNTKEAAASSCSINYPTTIENLQIELNKIKKAFTLFIERREKEKIMEKKERKKQMEQHTREVLSQIFTPGQIKVLMNRTKKRVVWLSEDIANAISLRCVSPKAYRYLRNVLKYPLPGLSTLRRYTASIKTAEKSFPRLRIQQRGTVNLRGSHPETFGDQCKDVRVAFVIPQYQQ